VTVPAKTDVAKTRQPKTVQTQPGRAWIASFTKWLTPSRIRAQAIVLALCLWGVCAIDFATPDLLDRAGNIKFQDFLPSYIAAQLIAEGRAAELYNEQVTATAMQASVAQPTRVRLPNLYGPQVGLFFAPLARFSFPVAARIAVATDSPAWAFRTASVTAAPWSASTRAVSAPMPEEAPVITARESERSSPAATSSAVECSSNGVRTGMRVSCACGKTAVLTSRGSVTRSLTPRLLAAAATTRPSPVPQNSAPTVVISAGDAGRLPHRSSTWSGRSAGVADVSRFQILHRS